MHEPHNTLTAASYWLLHDDGNEASSEARKVKEFGDYI
jgi:hypothetical protein